MNGDAEVTQKQPFYDRRITILCIGTALMDFTSHIASQVPLSLLILQSLCSPTPPLSVCSVSVLWLCSAFFLSVCRPDMCGRRR